MERLDFGWDCCDGRSGHIRD